MKRDDILKYEIKDEPHMIDGSEMQKYSLTILKQAEFLRNDDERNKPKFWLQSFYEHGYRARNNIIIRSNSFPEVQTSDGRIYAINLRGKKEDTDLSKAGFYIKSQRETVKAQHALKEFIDWVVENLEKNGKVGFEETTNKLSTLAEAFEATKGQPGTYAKVKGSFESQSLDDQFKELTSKTLKVDRGEPLLVANININGVCDQLQRLKTLVYEDTVSQIEAATYLTQYFANMSQTTKQAGSNELEAHMKRVGIL